ncbi:hypothetical protein D4S03_02545 [bacterium]|nr:MAG: hypothetical protein D4S03_02545 [bacterium]
MTGSVEIQKSLFLPPPATGEGKDVNSGDSIVIPGTVYLIPGIKYTVPGITPELTVPGIRARNSRGIREKP